jgi:hypothetical protein
MKGIAVILGNDRRDFFWLDQNFGMMASSPGRGLGFSLRFGGIFASAPFVVPSMQDRPVVVLARTREVHAEGEHSPVIRGVPHHGPGGGLLPLAQKLDIFGLGLDYAMYHKSFWGVFDEDDLGPWQNLGGVFTSAPAAIFWKGDRVDAFGLGTDHALYTKISHAGNWPQDWTRLGGTFTSPASLVLQGPNKLNVFVRGADYTLRGNQSDGTTWFGWQNHGGQLGSAPVAVSWGPDRIDIFAIFHDGALWHMWWDGQIWNEWESLGGDYVGEPAAVSWAPGRLDVVVTGVDKQLHHHWFEADTWSQPEVLNIGTTQGMAESPTMVSAAANRLEIFAPDNGGNIRIVTWDGVAWNAQSAGAQWRMPQRYHMSLDRVTALNTRGSVSDTDGVVLNVEAGNAKLLTRTQWIGDIGGPLHPKTAQTNLLVCDPVTVDLAEPMSLGYIVINNGSGDPTKVLAALASAGDALSVAGSQSMQAAISQAVASFTSTQIVGALTIAIPVLGTALAAIESWLLTKLTGVVLANCDGLVAVELRALMGRDLYILTGNGTHPVTVTVQHPGTDSEPGCGGNSDYEVTWTIRPL